MPFKITERKNAKPYTIQDLLKIMTKLRAPKGGCTWTKAQTFKSLTEHTLEEAYELVDAIEREDYDEVKAELGDVLNQVIFHAEIAREKGLFNFDEIVDLLAEKLIRRHPDVFAEGNVEDYDALEAQWQKLKKQERDVKAQSLGQKQPGIFDDIAINLPALSMTQKLQLRAQTAGFDQQDVQMVLSQLESELYQLKAAIDNDREKALEVLGDLIFNCTNLAHHLKTDAEGVLRQTNRKFKRHLQNLEALLHRQNRKIEDVSPDEWQALWQAQEKQTTD